MNELLRQSRMDVRFMEIKIIILMHNFLRVLEDQGGNGWVLIGQGKTEWLALSGRLCVQLCEWAV